MLVTYSKIIDPLFAGKTDKNRRYTILDREKFGRSYYNFVQTIITDLATAVSGNNKLYDTTKLPIDMWEKYKILAVAQEEYDLKVNIGALFVLAGYEVIGRETKNLVRMNPISNLRQTVFQIHGRRKRRYFKTQTEDINRFFAMKIENVSKEELGERLNLFL